MTKNIYCCKHCGGTFDYVLFNIKDKQLSVVVCTCTKLVKYGRKVLLKETTRHE